jgi:hypothetical protein
MNIRIDRLPLGLGKFSLPDSKNQWGIPEMLNTPLNIIGLLPFNFAHSTMGNRPETISFFLDDYQFERIWTRPQRYIAIMRRFNGSLSPDFSVWVDMPRALQIYNIYRSRCIGLYFQNNGIPCIPTVTWSDAQSFDFCFCGIPRGSCIAISSVSSSKSPILFREGFRVAIERIEPSLIIWYGNKIEGIEYKSIHFFDAFTRRFENGRKRIRNAREVR